MKGFVPTPESTVNAMVDRLFRDALPGDGARLLDPGCGYGAFIEGVLRWCDRSGVPAPEIVGVELDPAKMNVCAKRFARHPNVKLVLGDFLQADLGSFDFVIGNPPYVSISELSVEERTFYRSRFKTGRGRVDLYMLFWEHALRLLNPGGKMVFITPEKFTFVETAGPLREMLSDLHIEEIFFAPEETFPGVVSYPTITTLVNRSPVGPAMVETRDGRRRLIEIPRGSSSWQPAIRGQVRLAGSRTLGDVARRVSCGVATGADKVFVVQKAGLPPELTEYSHPTLAGRELAKPGSLPTPRAVMLTPYDRHGNLLPERDLGPLGDYLNEPLRRALLERRTCTKKKPWYAFHENPPMEHILRPKILCKDIAAAPCFWADRIGEIVPRHSVYYIVPRDADLLEPLLQYLNSDTVYRWLESNCQRASRGFLRLQSHILKQLPIPDDLGAVGEPVALNALVG